jgi:hypothetical protein
MLIQRSSTMHGIVIESTHKNGNADDQMNMVEVIPVGRLD